MDARPLQDLIHGHLDGVLSQSDSRALAARLAGDPAAAREFARAAVIHDRVYDALVAAETLAGAGRSVPGSGTVPPPVRRRVRFAVAAAALATAAAVVWMSWQDPAVGHLTAAVGDIRVTGGDGRPRAATAGTAVRSGDRIETEGFDSFAGLQLADGSKVSISGDASVVCRDDRGRPTLAAGTGVYTATVPPRPRDNPLLIATPAADVRVLGTAFTVRATPDRTEVDVSEGRVAMTRPAAGRAVEIPAGSRGTTDGPAGITVAELRPLADTWDIDFRNGVPAGWHAEFAGDRFPPNFRRAAAAKHTPRYGGHYIVGVRGDDERGLFAVRETTHVQLTFALVSGRPLWMNFFVATRSTTGAAPNVNFKSVDLTDRMPPLGRWRTVTVPLARFRRPGVPLPPDGAWTGPPPAAGDALHMLWVETPSPDRGLIVARVRVVPDGPGRVVVEDDDGSKPRN